MKNIKLETKKGFWAWLHKNRLAVVVMSFIILVPLSLASISYIGSYTSNKVVYFDAAETAETVYVRDFKGLDDIQGFEIFVEWDELKNAYQDDITDLWTGGYYQFKIHYQANPNYTINSIYVTPVLQTDWKDMRSLGSKALLTSNEDPNPIQIGFNYHLPVKPLPFVTVSEPNLYLKVEYSINYGGNEVSKTEYIKYSIKGLNPNLVIA